MREEFEKRREDSVRGVFTPKAALLRRARSRVSRTENSRREKEGEEGKEEE
jgi:hypothetical protein